MASWLCGQCGGEAVVVAQSLDPAHPTVSCRAKGVAHVKTVTGRDGIQRTIGLLSEGYATFGDYIAACRAKRAANAYRRHRRHIGNGQLKSCPVCQGLGVHR